jgi:hypothetical protein
MLNNRFPSIEELAHSNRELARSIKETSEKEIEARDRVDISRHEYEMMKMQIESLTIRNDYYHRLCEKLGIPSQGEIDLDTVRVWHDDMMSDMLNPLGYQGVKYRIEFVVKKV